MSSEHLWIIIGLIIAYLLGSFPSSVWIGKSFYKVDVRNLGSKNPGATNTFRVLGKPAGTVVLILDIVKGYLGASIPAILFHLDLLPAFYLNDWPLLFGLTSVLGHLFPVFLKFRGGKGVATLLGMVLSLHPWAAVASVIIFIVTLLLTSYVSLSSLVATLSFSLLQLWVPALQPDSRSYIFFGLAVFGLLVITHRSNIGRLIKGTESKASLFGSKTDQS